MMHMTFYWGINATILFDSWRTDSWPSYLLTLLALFLAAAFYQYLEERRIRFKILASTKPSSFEATAFRVPLLFRASQAVAGRGCAFRCVSSVLFGVNSAIGYLLMLSVMSFNGGVFIAIVVGLAVGYLVFRTEGAEDVVALENPCACA